MEKPGALYLETEGQELKDAWKSYADIIKAETLALDIDTPVRDGHKQAITMDGNEAMIYISKISSPRR